MLLRHLTGKTKVCQTQYLLFCILLGGCSPIHQKAKRVDQVAADTVLSVEQMQEDLDYTVEILKKVHPATYHGLSEEQQALIQTAYNRIQTPMEAGKFYFIANSVICSINDGHTHLYPMRNRQNLCVDIPLIWLWDELYVKKSRAPFEQGDKITAIGDKDIDTIFNLMRIVIPSENEHYRRCSAGDRLNRWEYLDYLGVIENDVVEFHIERAGEKLSITAPLKPVTECWHDKSSRPWVDYEIDKEFSLGIFRLDSCHYDQTYKDKVSEFFTEVSKNNIKNIAIDVRRNGGGNSMVVDEFLRYINIDKYKCYGGDIRYSKEAGTIITFGYKSGKPGEKKNRKVRYSELLFDGKLFIMTSPRTFSSANWFAVVIRDNNMGTVVGEPTGNAPSSYGDVPSFQMPNSGFRFSVSYKKWLRPDLANDPEDALYPDITVYTTIQDIINGTDPQLQKIKTMIRKNTPQSKSI